MQSRTMILVALAACVLAVSAARPTAESSGATMNMVKKLLPPPVGQEKEAFETFKATHNKLYATKEEHSKRFKIFQDNMAFCRDYNSKHTSHWTGPGPFADLTNAEYKEMYLGLRVPETMPTADEKTWPLANVQAPTDVDWRTGGAVTPVKDQGQCGSCWAFSSTGAMEGAHFIKNKELISISEQELVDCSTSAGNQGCNGGLMNQAFTWVKGNGGIDTEADYPYTASDGTCNQAALAKHNVTVTGFVQVPPSKESELMKAVSIGPVSVAIEADQQSFQMYTGGVFDGECGTQLDHGVLAVGYHKAGLFGGHSYWIVKNSWSTTWGESGYIRMAFGLAPHGKCGIALMASYPTV